MPKRKRKEEDGSKDEVKKYKGVHKKGKRYRAQISIDGKKHYPGTFDTSKEAAQAYDRAAIQAGRPTSKLNFLDQVPKNYKPKNNGQQSNNTTGFKGVTKEGSRFRAQITIGGKLQHIAMFGTAKEAAEAYDQAALQAKFPRSKLNFPDTIHASKKDDKEEDEEEEEDSSQEDDSDDDSDGYSDDNDSDYDDDDDDVKEERPKKKKRKFGLEVDVKYKGVVKIGERFRAYIYIDGKTNSLGKFDTPKEAAQAYDRAAIQAGRPTSKLNFLDQVPKNYKPMKKKLLSTNTTGFRGVDKQGNRFRAQIHIGGKSQYIGNFGTAKEAAEAYDQAALQAKFPRSDLNFPDASKKVDEEEEEDSEEEEQQQQQQHQKRSKFAGVTKEGKLYRASIIIDGKKVLLDIYPRAMFAALAHDRAAHEQGRPSTSWNYQLDTHRLKMMKATARDTGFRSLYVCTRLKVPSCVHIYDIKETRREKRKIKFILIFIVLIICIQYLRSEATNKKHTRSIKT